MYCLFRSCDGLTGIADLGYDITDQMTAELCLSGRFFYLLNNAAKIFMISVLCPD